MESEPGPEQRLNAVPLIFVIPTLVLTASGVIGWPIAAIVVLLICSALISGSEVAYFSFNPTDIQNLKNEASDKMKSVLKLISDHNPKKEEEKKRYLLATILIANNLINIGIVVTFYFLVERAFNFQDVLVLGFTIKASVFEFLISVIAVTFLLVLFGEVSPKIYANQNNQKLAAFMARPLIVLKSLFYPISSLLVASTKFIDKQLKPSANEIAIEELDKAIEITADKESTKKDIDILKGIIRFGNTTVTQIMRARMDVVALDIKSDFKTLLSVVKEHGYSRLPVYEQNIDQIKGILYAKDLLAFLEQDANFGWQKLIRDCSFVPESKMIDDLLKEMQENRVHLAVVVDEYGGTSGIITLEDIVEEVLGEIKDEFDDLVERDYKKIDEKNFVFEGKMQIIDACKVMNLEPDEFADAKGDADSMAGLILELFGRIPKEKEKLHYKNYQFTVMEVAQYRIERIKLKILDHVVEENV